MEQIVEYFKLTVDVQRLKILGLLALEPRSLQQLSDQLHIQPQLLMRHLERLQQGGIVKTDGNCYVLDTKSLETLARSQLSGLRERSSKQDFEGEEFDRKVLADFTLPGGRLKALPSQEKKLLVVLRWIAPVFTPGERYTEKQVNDMLRPYLEDTASLRRYLVDFGLLERQRGIYWRKADA